jgi:predicted NUDIX family NTP pyrophosphohydrolase
MLRMAAKISAGVIPFRRTQGRLEVFLVHPGGPFWQNRDVGAWSIAKGEAGEDEDLLQTARREFNEETGVSVEGDFIALAPVRQAGGKVVHAWAIECDFDANAITSNEFSLEWPPRSGVMRQFPEVDRGQWFGVADASVRVLPGQRGLIDELQQKLAAASAAASR